jgi:hypothetical protein
LKVSGHLRVRSRTKGGDKDMSEEKYSELLKPIEERYRKNPWSEELSWELVYEHIPKDQWSNFTENGGAVKLLKFLESSFNTEELFDTGNVISEKQICWERIGNFFKNLGNFHEAIVFYSSLYEKLIDAQLENNIWVDKVKPLVWISDCYNYLEFPVISKRYLMYALCEDAIRENGQCNPVDMASYWRLKTRHGMTEDKIKNYYVSAYGKYSENIQAAQYPEWIVQNLDDKTWSLGVPSPSEGYLFNINFSYLKKLKDNLGDSQGNNLESLAEYLLLCMPGCSVNKRKRSYSNEYDIVCSMEGYEIDFRSEFGRYFICECKDCKNSANVTTILKFCRILDSFKAKFGIIFSTKGISGKGKDRNAEREIYKMYQDRGVIIIVVDEDDIQKILDGSNFITMLKEKYEKVRLDLR